MKRIKSSYKLIEFLSGTRSGADTVVNVATIKFRFRAIVLIEKFVLVIDVWGGQGSKSSSQLTSITKRLFFELASRNIQRSFWRESGG